MFTMIATSNLSKYYCTGRLLGEVKKLAPKDYIPFGTRGGF